jgi:hypothetical protein
MPITTTLKSRAKLKGTLGHGGEPLIIRTSGGPIEIASN